MPTTSEMYAICMSFIELASMAKYPNAKVALLGKLVHCHDVGRLEKLETACLGAGVLSTNCIQ